MGALIVGLGNPGPEYETTRHNIGFLAIDALLDRLQSVNSQSAGSKFKCELYKGRLSYASDDFFIAKPQTFMNRSGFSVQALSAWYRIPPENILVIHDDLDIQPGFMRCKSGGGDAGHNGLKSISQCLGTPNYYRLRLGIGRPKKEDSGEAANSPVHSWVLGRMRQDECDSLANILPQIIDCIEAFVSGDTKKALRLGTLNPPKPPKPERKPKQNQSQNQEDLLKDLQASIEERARKHKTEESS